MRIIAISNQKGGIGKTTTTMNLGAGLAMKGKRVLLVDLDRQGNLSMYALPEFERAAKNPFSLFSVLSGEAGFSDVIEEVGENLSIIPAAANLDELRERAMSLDFSSLPFDYVLLDCPPAMEGATVSAIRASEGVIVPATADKFSFESLVEIYESLQTLGRKLNGILIGKYYERLSISKQLKEDYERLAAQIGTKVYPVVRDSVAIRESQLFKQSVFEYEPQGNGAADFAALAEEVLKEKQ